MLTIPRITLLLADDHQIFRQGLFALLDDEADLELVGEAADGLQAVALTEKLKPDVLLLDLTLPHLSGMEVLHQVSHRVPKTRVLILSGHSEDAYVREALKRGARGYLPKDPGRDEFLQAIREVAAGRRYLSPLLVRCEPEALERQSQDPPPDPYDTLTMREREVLHLAAEGKGSAEIAALLSISPRTAETHRAHLMHKLGLRNQTDVVRYALQRGIIE